MAEVLLQVGAGVDCLNSLDESRLTMQFRYGLVDGARFLLERGVNPNHGLSAHLPSDTMAARIELLLKHGWDINRGQLLHGANHGHGCRVQTWLKYGADPKIADANDQTALHFLAARGTCRDAIHTLVEGEANIGATNADGDTPLDLALKAGKQVAAEMLRNLSTKS